MLPEGGRVPDFEYTESIFDSEVSDFQIYERVGESLAEIKGVVLMLHGLGDYSRRHDEVADLLMREGYATRMFDWPGNGDSSGKRGHLPSVEEAGALICEALKRSDRPIEGIYAHSTGAFYLLHAIFSNPGEFADLKWVWLSSPLIYPRNGQSHFKIRLAEFLVQYLPLLTLSTGVRQSDCFHSENKAWFPVRDDMKLHNRVSLRAATDLMLNEATLVERVKKIPGSIAWLFTQGDEDGVCPLPITMGVFHDLVATNKTFVTISGARHEPMHEPDHSGVISAVRAWLKNVYQDDRDNFATSH